MHVIQQAIEKRMQTKSLAHIINICRHLPITKWMCNFWQ